jgi:glycosyltransferase involved in cell wall biosynthesis
MADETLSRDVVMLSTADWDNPFWTNKQHVAVELARRGHKILYIDSLGLRKPSASAQDFFRILKRLKKAFRAPHAVRERVWVWSPLVIPFQRFALIRKLNKALISIGLRFCMWYLGLRPQLFWTYNPMTLGLINVNAFECLIYHCVDEIKAQPGMPAEEIDCSENELVRRVDLCFVTAQHLLETRRTLNPNTHYFSNVADFTHFVKARDEFTPIPADLLTLPEPRIGFIGAISSYKVDFNLLQKMAESHPDWSIVLIGKVGEGDPWTDIAMLHKTKNLHFLGPRSYEKLPSYLKGFSAAILPSKLNEYTKGMFPMKFFEYLAAGLPVIATNLDALQTYRHVSYLAHDDDDFIAGVQAAIDGRIPALKTRIDEAAKHTYAVRTERMLALIDKIKANEEFNGKCG